MKKKRLARLHPVEDLDWVGFFNYYHELRVDNRPSRADRFAWKQLVKHHPRLAKYDGCLP